MKEEQDSKKTEEVEKEYTGSVPLSEDFQREVMELMSQCDTKEKCSFISSRVEECRSAIYKKEDEALMKKNKGKTVPKNYNSVDMPR